MLIEYNYLDYDSKINCINTLSLGQIGYYLADVIFKSFFFMKTDDWNIIKMFPRQ